MIALSRLNGRTVAVNPDLIVWIDVTPDTTLCLAGGDRIVVRESLDEVVQRILSFRKLVGPPSRAPIPDLTPNNGRRSKVSELAPARASFRAQAQDSIPARASIRTSQPIINRK